LVDHSRTLPRPAPGPQGRLQGWFDSLTKRMAAAPSAPVAAADIDLAGQTAFPFALVGLDGMTVRLGEVLDEVRPLLLVFVDPRSGACHEFMPDIGGWQRVYHDRLAIVLVSTGDPETNRAMTADYGIAPVLLQRDLEVIDAYGLMMAPAAVLVGTDGRIVAGPQYGPQAIRERVAHTLGLIVPPPPALEAVVIGRGDPAPPLRKPDLEGNIVDLDAFQGEPVLLLFWSPGCGYCQELLPHVLAFEQVTMRTRLLVISGGAIGVNQDLGFSSPVVLDDDHAIAQSFGVMGTPAAVLVGSRGNIVSDVARGAVAVRAYVDRCQMPEMTPFPDQPGF